MKTIKKFISSSISFVICLVILFVIIVGVQFVIGGVSLIFGFTYDSVGSMIIFFLLCGFVSFPLESVAKVIPRMLLEAEVYTLNMARLLFVVLDTAFSTIVFLLVENAMTSVSATKGSIIVFSFVFALLSVKKEVKRELTMEDVQEILEKEKEEQQKMEENEESTEENNTP